MFHPLLCPKYFSILMICRKHATNHQFQNIPENLRRITVDYVKKYVPSFTYTIDHTTKYVGNKQGRIFLYLRNKIIYHILHTAVGTFQQTSPYEIRTNTEKQHTQKHTISKAKKTFKTYSHDV